jgi:hypothetical protein
MSHYQCPNCHDSVAFDGFARVTWCNACGAPLTMLDLLPARISADRTEPEVTPEVERPGAVA